MRRTRTKYRDLPPLMKFKASARATTNVAVKRGKIVLTSRCARCGRADGKIEKHHPDHARPLDIVELCLPCHRAAHRAKLVIHGILGRR